MRTVQIPDTHAFVTFPVPAERTDAETEEAYAQAYDLEHGAEEVNVVRGRE
ncbi:hypothetical protein [Glaciibacter psychrotolerans]|uniref:Uncharacterized protein n=1 Tax=Glaciibacter psychrotolerans TaxID=670054 RepID=A0A7Z0EE15_9MICO|nr:hypothetical protein [Leifsonia psychrotolerans]NYJ19187.1 hypothetical protein [Leifsonia psychrotolerans]